MGAGGVFPVSSRHVTLDSLKAAFRSRRGHSILVFLTFLAISTLLWMVMALNDEDQADIRMPLRITHVPDSVTIITPVPKSIAVSLKTRGSQLLKLNFGHVPSFDIDFRAFSSGNVMRLGDADLKAIARSALDGSMVTLVSPDSLALRYTTSPGRTVPVRLDYTATPGPQATVVDAPSLSTDSVRVYFASPATEIPTHISSEPIRLTGLNQSATRRVRLIAPAGTRVIPDSIDVTFQVEPLILKTRRLNIESAHVPLGHKLITFPATVKVSYMVPMSIYKKAEPHMRAVADYNSIDLSRPTRMMRVRLQDVSPELQSVRLENDSVEYIIEKL